MTEHQFIVSLLLLGIGSNLGAWRLHRQKTISQFALFVAGILTGVLMKFI
jgi:hypothetical protein